MERIFWLRLTYRISATKDLNGKEPSVIQVYPIDHLPEKLYRSLKVGRVSNLEIRLLMLESENKIEKSLIDHSDCRPRKTEVIKRNPIQCASGTERELSRQKLTKSASEVEWLDLRRKTENT